MGKLTNLIEFRYRSEVAVTQIIGTMLLLMLAIGSISLIQSTILSDDGPDPETYIKIVGSVIGSNVIFEHQGGEALDLDTEISITLAGEEYDGYVSTWINDDNNNNKWNLGERMVFPFEYDLDRLGEFDEVDVVAVDDESNSIVLTGPIELNPVSDAGMTVTVDDPNPDVGDTIQITITITSYGGDVDGSGNVQVSMLLPEGLTYVSSYSPSGHGSYNNSTGLWIAGDVLVGSPAILKINATVYGIVSREFVQLALVLDGSGSISSSDWSLMETGLEDAIKNGDDFPRDGSVELTVVQFGDGSYYYYPYAQVEVGPVIITDDEEDPEGYYEDVAQDIIFMNQLEGYTPIDCGIRLAADQLYDEGNFSVDSKQVIILVTDGEPNCDWITGTYSAYPVSYSEGKISAEEARDYLLDKITMNEDNDEFNSLAVGSGPDISWLNNSIVWPEPGYIAPPFDNGSGWVSFIDDWEDFSDMINDIFENIFSTISSTVIIVESTTLDLNSLNDQATLVITPNG